MKAQTSLRSTNVIARSEATKQSTSGGAASTGRHSITQGFIPVPATRAFPHPVRDASLSGCGVTRGVCSSTERHSLTGMAPAHRHCEGGSPKQSTNRHEIPHSVRNDAAHGTGKKAVIGGAAAADCPISFTQRAGHFERSEKPHHQLIIHNS